MNKLLNKEDRKYLIDTVRREPDRRFADKIRALLHLDNGWSYKKISEALYLDDQTIRNYEHLYKEGGIDLVLTTNYKGGSTKLSVSQESELKSHLEENIYVSTKEIVGYIQQVYGVKFHKSGLVYTLHRLGFSYKKPKIVPGKADAEKQKEFVKEYEELKENKSEKDPIYHLDGVHPQHNAVAGYGWILKGKEKEIKANSGRDRVNLNGALNAETHKVVIREDKTINAQSTIALLKQLEEKHPEAGNIYCIADNARYYKAKLVKEYLETSRVRMIHLPPYSPNLNPIERLWKFFYKKVKHNKYYEKVYEFRESCFDFFENIDEHKDELASLLTDNFHIVNTA